MDDNELMARLKQGDTDALALLIRRHRPWALARAEGMLHDAALAEDVVQEAFVRVYLLRDRYSPAFAFSTWLGALVRNLCIDQLRRRRIAPMPVEPLPETGSEDSAEAAFLRKETRLALLNELAALDDTDRTLLTGFALEGESYQALAWRTGLTLGQVKIRLHRIRKRLRDKERERE